MKKIAIVGASAVLAALPVVGVFADTTTHTDVLELNISQVCTLGTLTNGVANSDDATSHANGTGSWSNDTLSASVSVGQAYANLGTTTFTVRCNDATGYDLTAIAGTASVNGATAGNLTNTTTSSYVIPTGAGTSATLTSDGNSYWNFFVSSVGNAYNASTNPYGQEIASGYSSAAAVPTGTAATIVTGHGGGNTNDGESITVQYGAGIDAYQEAGTYKGSVIYTLTAK